MTVAQIEAAVPEDWPDVAAMLDEAGLPVADLGRNRMPDFLVARRRTRLLGAVGLEHFGEHGLLRSLVIAIGQRGSGVGEALLRRLEEDAAARGITELWLLTIDADGYFARHGYRIRDRQLAPDAIRRTPEFSELCPGSAILMSRRLD